MQGFHEAMPENQALRRKTSVLFYVKTDEVRNIIDIVLRTNCIIAPFSAGNASFAITDLKSIAQYS